MTSEQIRHLEDDSRTMLGWLREIAFQLARINETREPFEPLPPDIVPKRVKR